MAQESTNRNPFMLMMHPEVVIAAMERSERLSQLNRHLCRPLDRPIGGQPGRDGETSPTDVQSDDDETHDA